MHRRLAANVLALLFVASAANALELCACFFGDMSSPHGRCMGPEAMATSLGHEGMSTAHGPESMATARGHAGIATPQMVMDCCAMAAQPSAIGTVEAHVNVKPIVGSRASVVPAAEHPDLMAAAGATVPLVHRGLPTVPIYLQHLSLLL